MAMQVKEYDLYIDLDFDQQKFKGRLFISLETDADVVLNSVGLEIRGVKAAEKSLKFAQEGQDLTITTGPFVGTLQVDYEGSIPDSLAGIYRAKYDHTHVVTTHFEPAQARQMLPCIDRPDVKAEFKLTVRINYDLDAISNMPTESVKSDGDKKIVTFQKTPRMSTYLLYLGVGNFQVQTEKLGNTDIILATPGKAAPSRFPLEEAKKALEFFNSYYGIPYTLPKVHLISVPEFAQGAMENWGAITFREVYLNIDANTSTRMRMLSSGATAHELAHQWFGDLVTMKWWDDIWLNESFATFMAYKAVESMHPDWGIRENWYNGDPRVETVAGALSRDCLKNTHAIQVPVKTPDEIEQIFDAISYGKGAHLLRMIEGYIGEDAFREGIRRYLSDHAYSNATGNDLWSSLQDASGKQVKRIMSTWVGQEGYPVLTASIHNETLSLRQERFLLSPDSSKSTWPVPVVLELNGKRTELLLEASEQSIQAKELTSLRINPDHTGFYLVHYVGLDEALWKSKLTAFDRWGIIFDAFQFLLAGKKTFDEYLTLIRKFIKETGTLPAKEVSNQLALLYALAPGKVTEISGEFHRYQLGLLKNGTDYNSSMLLGRVASRLALIDNDYAAKLGEDFKQYRGVPPDMRQAVSLAYARSTNDFEGLAKEYQSTGSDEDKSNFLNAMTAFTEQNLIRKSFEFALSGAVKRQDIYVVLFSAVEKPQARGIAWVWLQSNMDKLQALYQNTGILPEIFMNAIPVLGIGRVEEVEAFFAAHKLPGAEVGINAGLERLKVYDRLVQNIMQN